MRSSGGSLGLGRFCSIGLGAASRAGRCFERALESGEIEVDAPLDCARRERRDDGGGTWQLEAAAEVDERAVGPGGESVAVGERRRPRGRAYAELSGFLAGEDLE